MKKYLKTCFWCLLAAFAISSVTGCVVDDRDHRGHGPEYYGHGYGDHHDWDQYHRDHEHEW